MIDTYVTSSIQGRMRIRHPALRNERDALRLSNLLQGQSGILDITGNRRTGSLLVEYDSRTAQPGDLLAIFDNWLSRLNQSAAPPARGLPFISKHRAAVRCLNRGMLATLAFSVIMGMTGRTRAHVVSGGLFVAEALMHSWLYRKRL